MDIYDLEKPQKNLSADVAKRDIAAIERCHLRQCHLTLDQVTFQWNGSTWGKASLPTCVTGQYSWLLKEVSEKLFPIFWPMVGSKQVAQELQQEGGHVGWQREKSPFPHRPIPNVSPKNFFHVSFANATSVAMTRIGQTIWIHTRRWNTACGGNLRPALIFPQHAVSFTFEFLPNICCELFFYLRPSQNCSNFKIKTWEFWRYGRSKTLLHLSLTKSRS